MISKEFINKVELYGYDYKSYNNKNCINDKENIDISVLIPAYNVENYIEKCLDSLINQTLSYDKYEIIVVNDGSTDNTENILKKYSNITVINQNNMGISGARNTCLSNANGKYITFVDSDDYVDKSYLEELLKEAEKNNLDFVKCAYNIQKIDGEISTTNICEIERNNGFNLDDICINGYLWASLFKKSIWKNISFPENYWFEDMITRMLIYSRVKKYKIINKPLYTYVNHEISAVKKQGKGCSLKNLDQLFLVEQILKYKKGLNENIDSYFKIVLLKELLEMLPSRVRKIDKKIKKQVFLEACNIINDIDFKDIESLYLNKLKIFYKKSYIKWNISYYKFKIKKKLGVLNG